MTIISIVTKANWPISNLISFLEKLRQSLLDAHPVLTINEIYDLEMSKVMMDQLDYFFPEGKGDITVFSKDYVHNSSVRDRFKADIDLLLTQYKQSINDTFTVEEFITRSQKMIFETTLKHRISTIEKKVVDYEEAVTSNKEKEIRLKKEKERLMKEMRDIQEASKKMKRKNDDEYVNENREYYKRCRYYIDKGYDGYTPVDDLDIEEDDLTPEEIKEIIIEAHIKMNDYLVMYHQFPGCHDHGIDCDCGRRCTWTVGDHRCSCGNYKGFEFNTDDVDWEKDITLDSIEFCGRQERQW